MHQQGRHPAYPNTPLVKGFIRWRREEHGNGPKTIRKKLGVLKQIYRYWQESPSFPHSDDFNPFEAGQSEADLGSENNKQLPRISIKELREIIDSIDHIRDLLIVLSQLKLGLRATELCNVQIKDIHIANSELRNHYSQLGTNSVLDGYPNSIYIPHDREGNKSKRPRVVPIDNELRYVLLRYLLIRPDNEEPWLLLSKTGHNQMDRGKHQQPVEGEFPPRIRRNGAIRGSYVTFRSTSTHDILES